MFSSHCRRLLRLIHPHRDPVTGENAKLALSSGSLYKSQYRTEGPPQGNSILVFPKRCFRGVETVSFPLVDPWQTYGLFLSLLDVSLTAVLVAGSGKSVLWFVIFWYCCLHRLKSHASSGIIEDIKSRHDAGSVIMTYFYCDFRDEDKQNCQNLVLSIISQLCTQSNPCCDILSPIFAEHGKGTQKPSDETLTKCLIEMVSLPIQVPIYLIVDALDECPNNSGMPAPREELLDLVNILVSLRIPNLHICVTSRPEIDIQAILEPLTSLRVSLHDESGQMKDIVDYISSVVHSDTKMRRWREEDRELVIESLSEKADGM